MIEGKEDSTRLAFLMVHTYPFSTVYVLFHPPLFLSIPFPTVQPRPTPAMMDLK